jgi:exoribonuclease R
MIPGVLRLNSKVKFGMTSRNVPLYLFVPLNRKFSMCIVGSSHKDVSSNVLALVNVERWETDMLTRGNLIRILGKCGDQEAEEEAVFHQYSTATWKRFDKTTILVPPSDCYETITGYTFNVDPPGCQDIDDAITAGDDGYIYITIADVASWMHYNRQIFETASRLGQTLYKRGKVVAPLLPIEEECSLLPGKLRRGLALKFKFDGSKVTDISFQRVQIENNTSFTYESIYKSNYSVFLKKLASVVAEKNIDDSHEWIQQLMIFYNCEAAKHLKDYRSGLLRTQDEPNIERLREYSRLGADVEFLANKSAHYVHASTDAKHWGIGNDYYCHATSPIRRFADIVNQMVLSGYSLYPYDVAMINERSADVKKYERDMFFLFQVLNSKFREIDGITLNDHRIWVPDWKRIITCKNDYEPGTRGTLRYSVDMDQPTWKKRMVFRFDVETV